jgi:hypothetical protein
LSSKRKANTNFVDFVSEEGTLFSFAFDGVGKCVVDVEEETNEEGILTDRDSLFSIEGVGADAGVVVAIVESAFVGSSVCAFNE